MNMLNSTLQRLQNDILMHGQHNGVIQGGSKAFSALALKDPDVGL